MFDAEGPRGGIRREYERMAERHCAPVNLAQQARSRRNLPATDRFVNRCPKSAFPGLVPPATASPPEGVSALCVGDTIAGQKIIN